MEPLHEVFELSVSTDKMDASLHAKQTFDPEELTVELILKWLDDQKITVGIQTEAIEKLVANYHVDLLPIKIAVGTYPVHGLNGKIDYVCEQDDNIEVEEKRNFRDVKKIPSLKEEEKIAVVTAPVLGTIGYNIYGKKAPAKPGKPIRMRAGKNVVFNEYDQSFYATADGQLSIGANVIQVFNTYEVIGDLSLKTGNLNFVGSITIRGNIPSGYRVEAEGDIHIYGLVESAYIQAGGNVFISEGIAGQRKGTIIAGADVTVKYINQAIVDAGKDIIVHNTIMHSHCVAQEHIYCQSGNIIGGVCSAGKSIEVKDIGNKMETKTEIAIGINQEDAEEETKLLKEKEILLENKEKLRILGESLNKKAESSVGLTGKERIFLLKQRNSVEQADRKLEKIEEELSLLQVEIGDADQVRLIVKGSLYENVDLSFGKYQMTTRTTQKFTQVYLENGEITSKSL
ncbi:DUF342 domain-containing protein [Paraliobacillus sediminis]|uniref:DUF342 domain-containing protein n=1 Tax=Paraliobacillus sediminis TaxID=1885916 RepID=UPI000E3D2632|nr:FapA family protein [Paraliobacillus sediminis]